MVEEKKESAEVKSRKLTRKEKKKAKKPVTYLNPQVSNATCTDPFGLPLGKWRTQKDIFLATKRSCSGHNSSKFIVA